MHTEVELVKYADDTCVWWVVRETKCGTPVAFAGLRATNGAEVELCACGVMKGWRGFGIQRELIKRRLRFARELDGVKRVTTHTASYNWRSLNNLVDAGFRATGITETAENDVYAACTYIELEKVL
jgi:GNAT superfamily N-acetyltransferase